MKNSMGIDSDREPMTPEHPHLESVKKEFRRHKFGYLFGGLCLGAIVAGAIAASAGHFGAGWDKVRDNRSRLLAAFLPHCFANCAFQRLASRVKRRRMFRSRSWSLRLNPVAGSLARLKTRRRLMKRTTKAPTATGATKLPRAGGDGRLVTAR